MKTLEHVNESNSTNSSHLPEVSTDNRVNKHTLEIYKSLTGLDLEAIEDTDLKKWLCTVTNDLTKKGELMF